MLKQFFKDTSLYAVATFLSRGIAILLIPLYTRLLSPEQYGIIDLIMTFGALVNLTVALEITQGVAIFYTGTTVRSDKSQYASTALLFTLLAYAIFTIAALAFSQGLSALILDSSSWNKTFLVGIAAITLNGIFYFLQNQMRWQLKSDAYAFTSIVSLLANVSVTVIMVLFLKKGPEGFLWGQVFGCSAGILLGWWHSREDIHFKFSLLHCKEMLMFSLPLVPSSASVFVAQYVDRIAIKTLMTVSDVGLYGIGFRFASIVNLIMTAVNAALTPLILNKYNNPGTPQAIARIFNMFVIAVVVIVSGLSLFSREILVVFTTRDFYAAAPVIPILAFAVIMLNAYIFLPGLTIARKTPVIAGINIFCALLNVGLNFSFIPVFGIKGAALASLISGFVTFGCYFIFGQRYYPIPYNWSGILTGLTPVLLCTGAGMLIKSDTLSLTAIVYKLMILAVSVFVTTLCVFGKEGLSLIVSRVSGLAAGGIKQI